MTAHLYVLPMITTSTPKGPLRYPKYTDTTLSGVEWVAMDYGNEPWSFLAADVPDATHTLLVANTDVLALPTNLDQTVGAQLTIVQNALESRNIPAGWVQSGFTYRQILRIVMAAFQFMQRCQGLGLDAVFGGGVTLDTRFNQLPVATRQLLVDAANSFGYNTSTLSGTSTLRTILKAMADQWRQLEFTIGIVVV